MNPTESPIKKVASETLVTTLAELHVHGVLAGLGFLIHHWMSGETIAIVITTGSGMVWTRAYMREKRIYVRFRRGVPRLVRIEDKVVEKWFTKNF